MKCNSISRALLVVLAINLGTLPLRGSDERIAGVRHLSTKTSIKVDHLIFEEGSEIVTNGNDLTISAGTISVGARGARIISFKNMEAAAGKDGQSAGLVFILAQKVEGGQLEIKNVGQDGGSGPQGGPGAKGGDGHQGTQRDYNVFNGCIGGSNGTPGLPGAQGSPGSDGGSGGSGGAVVLSVKEGMSFLKIDVHGGKGGQAGLGGPGGPGGAGGQGAPGKALCGGTGPGPGGSQGPQGPPGQPGRQGRDGSISKVDL